MTKPSTRLITAALIASGFVLFRFLYALVFTGANSGTTIIDSPGIRLWGIFSHVTLFGPVGDLGLLRVIESALPFALVILAFGVFSFFVGPEKIAALAFQSRSNFFKAAGIGLALLPSLAEATSRVLKAQEYRSAPKRYAAVPLLETAIERANAVSLALSTRQVSPQLTDYVEIRQVQLGSNLTSPIRLHSADLLLVQGPTGSGKTTLLRSLSVQTIEKNRVLDVEVFGYKSQANPSEVASLSKYVPQQPRDGFLGWQLQPSSNSAATRQISKLSEGEAVRHAISQALDANPKLLVLDEPFASLDDEACRELNQQLANYRDSGGILVIAEHDLSRVDLDNPQVLRLEQDSSPPAIARRPALVGSELLIEAENQKLYQGDLVCLLGPNGIGKTTMLKRILVQAQRQKLPTRFVPERVEDLFLTQSLAEELALSDKLSRSKNGLTQASFESLLPLSDQLLSTHPRDLSAGTKLVLALSIAIALKPQLLLIDEPVKGLDAGARANMAEVLACVQETGCAIVFATHDREFAAIANRRIELSERVIR